MMAEMFYGAEPRSDHAEIERLAFLYGRGNDISASFFDQCMCEDVEVVYPFGSWSGLETHKRMRDSTIGVAFAYTQHYLTNPLIEVNGATAKAQYYVFAAHGMKTADKAVVYAGAIYNHDLVRTEKGWRIRRHHCETLWIDDAGGLMDAVEASMPAA